MFPERKRRLTIHPAAAVAPLELQVARVTITPYPLFVIGKHTTPGQAISINI